MRTKLQTEDSKLRHEPLALGHDAPGAARRCQRLGTPTTQQTDCSNRKLRQKPTSSTLAC